MQRRLHPRDIRVAQAVGEPVLSSCPLTEAQLNARVPLPCGVQPARVVPSSNRAAPRQLVMQEPPPQLPSSSSMMEPDPVHMQVSGQNFAVISCIPGPNGRVAMKMRGCFFDERSAGAHAEKLMRVDPHFDIHVVSMYNWVLLPPEPEELEGKEAYVNEHVADMMRRYRQTIEAAQTAVKNSLINPDDMIVLEDTPEGAAAARALPQPRTRRPAMVLVDVDDDETLADGGLPVPIALAADKLQDMLNMPLEEPLEEEVEQEQEQEDQQDQEQEQEQEEQDQDEQEESSSERSARELLQLRIDAAKAARERLRSEQQRLQAQRAAAPGSPPTPRTLEELQAYQPAGLAEAAGPSAVAD